MSPSPSPVSVPSPALRVLFFGHLPQWTGAAEVVWPVPNPPTVAALLESLYEEWPSLRAADPSLQVAVDLAYASRDAAVREGAEVAVMPPVQGG